MSWGVWENPCDFMEMICRSNIFKQRKRPCWRSVAKVPDQPSCLPRRSIDCSREHVCHQWPHRLDVNQWPAMWFHWANCVPTILLQLFIGPHKISCLTPFIPLLVRRFDRFLLTLSDWNLIENDLLLKSRVAQRPVVHNLLLSCSQPLFRVKNYEWTHQDMISSCSASSISTNSKEPVALS